MCFEFCVLALGVSSKIHALRRCLCKIECTRGIRVDRPTERVSQQGSRVTVGCSIARAHGSAEGIVSEGLAKAWRVLPRPGGFGQGGGLVQGSADWYRGTSEWGGFCLGLPRRLCLGVFCVSEAFDGGEFEATAGGRGLSS